MAIDRARFFDDDHFRKFFDKILHQPQVDGYDAIFDYWDAKGLTDLRWLAYILATAYHETGRLIQPVREGFCQTDACSINAVTRLFKNGIIKVNYALPDPVTGKSYFGRGLVQLTFAANYKKLGAKLGIDLFHHPELALDLDTSVKILVDGMVDGDFSPPNSLSKYFNSTTEDWDNARKIINGTDHHALIAGYGRNFLLCLK